jgi:hypothetical protein
MRNLTPDVIAELTKTVVRPFVLCDIEFADQWIHVWTGIGNLASGGNTYKGVGALGKISAISETTDVQANGVALSLSGIPGDVVAESLAMCRQGLPVTVSLGFMRDSGGVIASPVIIFQGRMDTVTVDEGGDTCMITISVESRLIDLKRPRVRRFTDDDQQRTSPGDKGFQYVPMVQDWNGGWGSGAH